MSDQTNPVHPSSRIVRNTTLDDLEALQAIYAHARAYMKANGNPNQWKDNRPSTSSIVSDIEHHNAYVLVEDGEIIGAFSMIPGPDPTYAVIENGSWLSDLPYSAIHKIASSGTRPGVFKTLIKFCESRNPSLRIDTHADNLPMQHLIQKNGFTKCGIIYTDDGTPRIAYQKDLI